jgi:hypothetical protein
MRALARAHQPVRPPALGRRSSSVRQHYQVPPPKSVQRQPASTIEWVSELSASAAASREEAETASVSAAHIPEKERKDGRKEGRRRRRRKGVEKED